MLQENAKRRKWRRTNESGQDQGAERVFPFSAADAQHCTREQYDRAYSLFDDEGWTIPNALEEVGIPFEIEEKINDHELHDQAMEHHDPANCRWRRERIAGGSYGSRRKVYRSSKGLQKKNRRSTV